MASSSFNSSFPSNHHHHHHHHHKKHWKKIGLGGSVVAIAVAAAAAAAGATSAQLINKDCSKRNPLWMQCSSGSSGFSPFASVSHHSQSLASSFTEPRTGVSFPTSIVAGDDEGKSEDLHLAGTGLRKKNILGLKNITVYAFGVYADEIGLKEKLSSETKYAEHAVSDLKQNKEFYDDLTTSDFKMGVRLVIVYGRLKIGSVRSAFEDSIGSRLKKFNGKEDRPLLESFTKLFRDDIKLPAGTIIDITRHSGHILKTKIGDTELGAVQSPLLCRALLDLYIGEEAFDPEGKEEIGSKLAAIVRN